MTYPSSFISVCFKKSWPVMLGYLPMAIAFGILASDPIYATISGVFVYAGASQFLSLKLLESQASLYEIALSTFVLNVRHVFYSLHFSSYYSRLPFFKKWYSVYTLTDETYAVLAKDLHSYSQRQENIIVGVSALNHMTWFVGCGLGAVFKQYVGVDIKGLDFMLVALFIVLLVESIKKLKNKKPVLIAGIVSLLFLNLQIPGWLFFAMTALFIYGLWSQHEPHV